ncbi:hypothetical protein A1122_21477 (plasmid) [Yersinia pestis A1122]|nr:hypothetical protein A1122_21477 [Yersinia pestis A1122]
MATIAYGSAGINTGTEITPTRCNKPVFIP